MIHCDEVTFGWEMVRWAVIKPWSAVEFENLQILDFEVPSTRTMFYCVRSKVPVWYTF